MFPIKSRELLAAFGGAVPVAAMLLISTSALAASPRPSVIVFNQPVKSNAIDITYANLPRDGYAVVLTSDASGKPSTHAVGSVNLTAGDHRDVKVALTEATKPGEKLWLSLYSADSGKAPFDAKTDKAMWPGNLPLQNMFMVK